MTKHIKNAIAALAAPSVDQDQAFMAVLDRNGPEKVQKASDAIGAAYDGSDDSFNDFLIQLMGGEGGGDDSQSLADLDNAGDGSAVSEDGLSDDELYSQMDDLINQLCGQDDGAL